MSKIALQGDASGTGTFTIAAPNSNSNPTLTLPTSSGTVVVTGGAQTIEFAAGTAAAPSITFTGDTNTGIFSPAADTIAFAEGGAEAMRIDSSGNVGIGTTSPTASASNKTVTINGPSGSGALIDFKSNETLNFRIFSGSASSVLSVKTATPLIFDTNDTERMRIDSSGNVGIGNTAPTEALDVSSSSAAKSISVGRTPYSTYGNLLFDGTNNAVAAYTNSNGNSSCNVGATRITYGDVILFSTSPQTAAGSARTWTERARITSAGEFVVGKTSTGAGVGTYIDNTGVINTQKSGTANTSTTMEVYSTGASAFRFYVGMGGTIYATSTTITAISDQRLKENIQDIDVGLDAVMALKPRKFDWKEGKGKDKKGDRGWIAQEFEQVFPDMIDTWKDEPPEGEEPYKSVNADLIPVLVKAIQELKAITDAQTTRIEALEAEVAALKGQ